MALLAAGCLSAVDISGSWVFEVVLDVGTGSPSFVFKQEGEKLTGTYSGQLGQANLNGTVKGNAIEFEFKVSPTGESTTVKYKGQIESATSMKGTVDIPGLGQGSWKGSKK